MLKNKKVITLLLVLVISLITLATNSFAITEADNGIMKIYTTSGGLEFDGLKGFDIQGYVTTDDSTNEKTLISSTFSDDGYHTFLNVNGLSGEMDGELTSVEGGQTWKEKAQSMQYTEVTGEGWQTINGINIKTSTQFINNGEQLQIVYDLKNTTSSSATISLATASDVQIDGDDSATIERLEDGSGVRLWTKEGNTDKPVQFVFYGKDVTGTTNIDNLWIGNWGGGNYLTHLFDTNPDIDKIENRDSAFAYSWVNRTINAGETKVYTVLMEVGEINIPNTAITLEDNTKFYYTDVKINGTVIDKDLKDKIVIHYTVDGGTEYTLPEMSTTGTDKEFVLDLTSLNLSAGTNHTLKVWATDSTDCDSNVVERNFTVTYLKNPELSVSETEWTKDDVTFRISDAENVNQYVDKYQYRINNGEWVDCEKDIDIPVQENGMVQIDARIVGTEANDYSDVITKYAKVDKVNPTTTIPTATKTTCTITVTSSQTDEHSGIDTSKTMYAIKKGDSWSEWQASNTFTGLTHNTDYIVKTQSTDMVGNSSESEELTVKTDELLLGKLILKLNSNEGENYTENTWSNKNIYVAIEEQSVGATTTYYSKEGSSQTIPSTNQETIVAEDGKTTLLLSVTDGTNTITSDVEHILKLDKIAPVINELSLDNDEWTATSKNITGKAIDTLSGIVAYQFSTQDNITISSEGWNNIENTTAEITQTSEVNESGNHYFYVKDAAGNIASVHIDTKIDTLDPVITFARANGKTTINVTDTGAGVKSTQYAWTTENIEPSETDWKNYLEPVSYDGTSKEKIYLWAKAADNTDNTVVSSTLFNAIKKPTIISEDSFTNEYAKFKLNSENEDDDIIYEFKINDGEWNNITENMTYTISNIKEGKITISARVIDNAGRISEITTKSVQVSIVEIPGQDDDNGNEGNNVNNESENKEENKNQSNDDTIKEITSDKTTSDKVLPNTGISKFIIIAAVALIIGVALGYKNIIKYKDIK